jgi:DNA-binding transcriptional ArsR family regulator
MKIKLGSTIVDTQKAKDAAKSFRALNHDLRQSLLQLIGETPRTVTELYVLLNIEQAVCSQHLAVLRKAALVSTKRDGKYITYYLDETRLQQLMKISDEILTPAKDTTNLS